LLQILFLLLYCHKSQLKVDKDPEKHGTSSNAQWCLPLPMVLQSCKDSRILKCF